VLLSRTAVRRLFVQCSISTNANTIDTHSLKRAARKLLKQYNFDLHDFPNLATQEKISFLKTLFVRKYLERKTIDDDESWNEQIKVSFQTVVHMINIAHYNEKKDIYLVSEIKQIKFYSLELVSLDKEMKMCTSAKKVQILLLLLNGNGCLDS
jgi:hypothetical protein